MIRYRIEPDDLHGHHYRVTLTVPQPAAVQRLSLPVWINGSYMVREFGRHLSGLQARQGRRDLALRQLDKTTWEAACSGRAALVVRYRVYAFDTSVRAAFLDSRRGFFNGTSLCLRVHGREADVHRLHLGKLPRGWDVATAMPPAADGTALAFEAADYDDLVDHPVELGASGAAASRPAACRTSSSSPAPARLRRRAAAGRRPPHLRRADRLLACRRRQPPPFGRYVFLLNAWRTATAAWSTAPAPR
jgi:predicted metalloprotease with PDZ domain